MVRFDDNKVTNNLIDLLFLLLVYTAFAFFEYVVVLTNMGFHMTAYFDLWQKDLVLHSRGLTFISR